MCHGDWRILAANPDELRDAKLMEYLEQKDNSLPDYMINILKEVALGTTYKTTLQQEMTRYQYEKVRAAEDIIRSIISEPELDMIQLRNWLDNLGELEYDKQIISTYIQEGNFSSALALAELLPSLYNLQDIDLIEHENFIQMLNLQNTLYTQNRTFNELTTEELALVEDMSENSVGSAGTQASSILEAYYDRDFARCRSLQGETSYKSQSIDLSRLSDAYGFAVSVQPNPASNWLTIDYSLPLNGTSAELVITSTTGSIVRNIILQGNIGQKVIDLSNIPSGSYSYNIKSLSFIKSGKIIVVK